jgi:hypothetical protein
MNCTRALAVTCLAERDGWIHPDLALFQLKWMQRNTGVIHFISNYRPHHNARNQAVNMFMKGGEDWLFMVDNDTVPPDAVFDLFGKLDGKDIVAIPYPYYRIREGRFIVTDCLFPKGSGLSIEMPTGKVAGPGFSEVAAAGAGCLLVNRRVFEKLERLWFRTAGDATDPGEDLDFCLRAREAGFKIWTTADYGRAEHFKTIPLSHLY